MSISAGKLRHRVKIQEYRFVSQDPVTGEEQRDWVTVRECWASIEPLSAREFVAAQSTQSKVSARIVIRYADDLDASMRIVHVKRGKQIIYNIEGNLPDKDSGLEYITFPVSHGVSINGQ